MFLVLTTHYIFLKKRNNAKSWKLLRDAGRTQLMKNADVLEKESPTINWFGINGKMVGGLKGSRLGLVPNKNLEAKKRRGILDAGFCLKKKKKK